MMTSAPPFTLAEFGELVSAALEEAEDPERTHNTLSYSRRSFLSFSSPKPRRSALAPLPQVSAFHSPRSFFFSSPTTMLHTPLPLHSMDAMSHLDLTQHCMPPLSPSTPTRPSARQVLNRLKRQASALVKSPTIRLRSVSCSQPGISAPPADADSPVPTVTLVSATSVHSSSSGRSRSASCACDDGTATLHIAAPSGGDFTPYLPLAAQLERERRIPHPTGRLGSPDPISSRTSSVPPALGHVAKRRLVPPSSPSPSERSDSTMSTGSPATPVFPHHAYHDVHPYAYAASALHRWSTGSDDRQNSDPLAKSKLQVVRRSLIQDSFLQACAAAGDVPSSLVSASNDDGPNTPKRRMSTLKKKSTASLPPVKPPPSCPLPSPPLTITSGDSDSSFAPLEKSRKAVSTADEEWTLYLGAPSQPLELSRDTPRKEIARERSGSSPSIYSTKQHLSPEDIPPQIQQQSQPRLRTTSNLSTRSSATTRRIESGPAPSTSATPAVRAGNEDWTLSLPLLKKPKSSLCIDSTKQKEVVIVAEARRCKSFTEWTTNLPDELEKLRKLEREEKRERKSSKVSVVSVAASQVSMKPKRQLPIGPGPSSSCTPSSPASPTGTPLSSPKSTASLRSRASNTSMASTSSYFSASASPLERAPFSPSTPSLGAATFTYASTISASTSVSTLSKFPLPPSFSSKLLQRRQAAPPMPKPLLPTRAFASAPSPCSLRSLRNATTYSPIETPVASAPATASYFPMTKCLKLKSRVESRSRSNSKECEEKDKGKQKAEGKYFPPSTASSTSSSSSSSVRTVSSTATIVPSRRQQQRLMARVEELEAKMAHDICSSPTYGLMAEEQSRRGRERDRGEGLWRDSLGSTICEGEFETCTEGGFSVSDGTSTGEGMDGRVETDAMSMVSGVYYSARSSLNM